VLVLSTSYFVAKYIELELYVKLRVENSVKVLLVSTRIVH